MLGVAALGDQAIPETAGDVLATAPAAGVYLAALGFIAVGVAAVARSVAGAITAMFVLLAVLPPALRAGGTAPDLLPSAAGLALMTSSPLAPIAILLGWVAICQCAAIAVLRSRDA